LSSWLFSHLDLMKTSQFAIFKLHVLLIRYFLADRSLGRCMEV
jgi:hypothetical protein